MKKKRITNSTRPIVTPYELASLAVRLAQSKGQNIHLALVEAVDLMARAVNCLPDVARKVQKLKAPHRPEECFTAKELASQIGVVPRTLSEHCKRIRVDPRRIPASAIQILGDNIKAAKSRRPKETT